MKLTKQYLRELLTSTISTFNKQIMPIDHEVELEFIEKDEFMQGVKNDPLIQQQILLGIYKNLDKEYPNFLVVYNEDKNPMRKLLGLPYKITVCYDMAKDILKPFHKQEVKLYMERTFAHELSHIVEDELIQKKPELWNSCLKETGGNEQYAKEILAENIADMIGDNKMFQKVSNTIWSLINNRVKKLEKNQLK